MNDWEPYVPVAERRRNAVLYADCRLAPDVVLAPVRIAGRGIAHTFWGQAWCTHLEGHSDFANRLPRGRRYARNGSLVDLRVQKTKESGARVEAIVAGSEPYVVSVQIDALTDARWQTIQQACAGQIGSLIELLSGRLSDEVMAVVTRRSQGLLPAPSELHVSCTCPDWATMCKHVAATLYGVGARLDSDPTLLFTLRGVEPADLVDQAVVELTPQAASGRVLSGGLSAVFGVDMDDGFDDDGFDDDGFNDANFGEVVAPAARVIPPPAATRVASRKPRKRPSKRVRAAAIRTLNPTGLRVMSVVYNEAGLDAAMLAERLGAGNAATDAALIQLVDAGLIQVIADSAPSTYAPL